METKSRSFKEKAKERLGFTFGRIRSRTPDTESAPSSFGVSERVWSTTQLPHVHSIPTTNSRQSYPIANHSLDESWDRLPECTKQQVQSTKKDEVEMTNGSQTSGDNFIMENKKEKRKSRHIKPEGSLDYEVSDRDTLRSIAAKFDTTPSELKKLNRLMSDVIFPGQLFYIPDKNYVPPVPPAPAPVKEKPPVESPAATSSQPSTPDNIIRQLEKLPLRGPGYAQRSSTSSAGGNDSDTGSSHSGKPKSGKMETDECQAKFIKVDVKHITDGQGVIKGVLLVTPNAVMFDPDVSDEFVKENSVETYGMVVDMESIISAAMFQDLTSMKIKGVPQDDSKASKPIVYHNKSCPLYEKLHPSSKHDSENFKRLHQDSLVEEDEVEESVFEDLSINAKNETGTAADENKSSKLKAKNRSIKKQRISSSNRQDSICSCGAMQNIPAADTVTSSQTDSEQMDINSTKNENLTSTKDDQQNVSLLSDCNPEHFGEKSERTNTIFVGDSAPQKTDTDSAKDDSAGQLSSTVSEELPQSKPDLLADIGPDGGASAGLISRTFSSLSSSPKVVSQFVDGLFTKDDPLEKGDGNHTIVRTSKGIEIEIRSGIKMDEASPDLFKGPEEIDLVIHKPADYLELPLFLRLKTGIPKDKKPSTSCPIKSYSNKKPKSEYWFSIPKSRVDHLYEFFVNWLPEIYGDESELSAREKGFIVIDDDDEEIIESTESLDDSFDMLNDSNASKPRKLVRTMSKNWEIITKDELKRRQSVLTFDYVPAPELSEDSIILKEEDIKRLSECLPARTEGMRWQLSYSTDKNGISLKTLYRNVLSIDGPTLLVVRDTHNQVFGSFLSCEPKVSDHFYGTGESFLFTFYEEFKQYKWTGVNNFIARGNYDCLIIGSGCGHAALWLDGNLNHGRTQSCETFDNQLLTDNEDFRVSALEVWAFL